MKKKILKARKAAAHAKPAAQTKRCGCCGESPCLCPADHGHTK